MNAYNYNYSFYPPCNRLFGSSIDPLYPSNTHLYSYTTVPLSHVPITNVNLQQFGTVQSIQPVYSLDSIQTLQAVQSMQSIQTMQAMQAMQPFYQLYSKGQTTKKDQQSEQKSRLENAPPTQTAQIDQTQQTKKVPTPSALNNQDQLSELNQILSDDLTSINKADDDYLGFQRFRPQNCLQNFLLNRWKNYIADTMLETEYERGGFIAAMVREMVCFGEYALNYFEIYEPPPGLCVKHPEACPMNAQYYHNNHHMFNKPLESESMNQSPNSNYKNQKLKPRPIQLLKILDPVTGTPILDLSQARAQSLTPGLVTSSDVEALKDIHKKLLNSYSKPSECEQDEFPEIQQMNAVEMEQQNLVLKDVLNVSMSSVENEDLKLINRQRYNNQDEEMIYEESAYEKMEAQYQTYNESDQNQTLNTFVSEQALASQNQLEPKRQSRSRKSQKRTTQKRTN